MVSNKWNKSLLSICTNHILLLVEKIQPQGCPTGGPQTAPSPQEVNMKAVPSLFAPATAGVPGAKQHSRMGPNKTACMAVSVGQKSGGTGEDSCCGSRMEARETHTAVTCVGESWCRKGDLYCPSGNMVARLAIPAWKGRCMW